jgi:hypothetical protein
MILALFQATIIAALIGGAVWLSAYVAKRTR